MNATTPIWALAACLAATLAVAPVGAEESCLPVQQGPAGPEYHPECMPSSAAANSGPAPDAVQTVVRDVPDYP
jgi:hypothetical protein